MTEAATTQSITATFDDISLENGPMLIPHTGSGFDGSFNRSPAPEPSPSPNPSQQSYSQPNGSVSEEMECPHSKVGMVIGAKGVIIQEIMNRTHCKIVVIQDNLPDGHPRNVVITGAPVQVQAAKSLIAAVINDGPSALQTSAPGEDPSEPTETEEMLCPPDKVGLVIGSKGVVIQDIMRRSYCKITVNQNFPEGEPRMVVICGKRSQIEKAKSLVALVIANGPTALNSVGNSTNMITEEMDCPQEKVGIVIGARGSIVQDIMRKCGCRIVIHQDFPEGQPRKVVFTGTPHQVEAGKNLVSAVIMHGPAAVQMSMGGAGNIIQDLKIIQAQVGKLIGPGGSTIKDIQQRFAVKMNIDQVLPDTDERRLRITGEASRVQAAAQMVWHVLHSGGGGMMGGGVVPQQQPYGMPMMGGYSDGTGAMMHPAYYTTPPVQGGAGPYGMQSPMGADGMQHMQSAMHSSVGQGLGADGLSGRIMPATPMNNGMMHQVVYVYKSLMGRIAGKEFATLALMMSKSGANIQIEQALVLGTNGQEMCKINIIGNQQGVTLAGQMIQEVLINGPDKLMSLPDASASNTYALDVQRTGAGQLRTAIQEGQQMYGGDQQGYGGYGAHMTGGQAQPASFQQQMYMQQHPQDNMQQGSGFSDMPTTSASTTTEQQSAAGYMQSGEMYGQSPHMHMYQQQPQQHSQYYSQPQYGSGSVASTNGVVGGIHQQRYHQQTQSHQQAHGGTNGN
mmetsp:Transcript_22521/g.32899  ORF Transcript_22521/g.32899 Transcript_22521/m.32899 type:complete len:732 (-) Transcript_22521:333-2528(-)